MKLSRHIRLLSMALVLHLSMALRLIRAEVDGSSRPVPNSETKTVTDLHGDGALDTFEVTEHASFPSQKEAARFLEQTRQLQHEILERMEELAKRLAELERTMVTPLAHTAQEEKEKAEVQENLSEDDSITGDISKYWLWILPATLCFLIGLIGPVTIVQLLVVGTRQLLELRTRRSSASGPHRKAPSPGVWSMLVKAAAREGAALTLAHVWAGARREVRGVLRDMLTHVAQRAGGGTEGAAPREPTPMLHVGP